MRFVLALALLTGCGAEDVSIPLSDYKVMSDFSLPDVNPNSASAGENVSAHATRGAITAWYFSKATCSYCRGQFGFLNAMQNELSDTPTSVRILGVNAVDAVAGNETIVVDRTLPWLQDDAAVDAWGAWEVRWRDVVVLDAEGKRLHVYNLTEHDLADEAHYDALKNALEAAAQ